MRFEIPIVNPKIILSLSMPFENSTVRDQVPSGNIGLTHAAIVNVLFIKTPFVIFAKPPFSIMADAHFPLRSKLSEEVN